MHAAAALANRDGLGVCLPPALHALGVGLAAAALPDPSTARAFKDRQLDYIEAAGPALGGEESGPFANFLSAGALVGICPGFSGHSIHEGSLKAESIDQAAKQLVEFPYPQREQQQSTAQNKMYDQGKGALQPFHLVPSSLSRGSWQQPPAGASSVPAPGRRFRV